MTHLYLTFNFFSEAFRQILLGIIQGLTEFLPISSTAHLIILPKVFGWSEPGLTSIASIQLGSLLAVFIYFRNDISDLVNGFRSFLLSGKLNSAHSKLSFAILIGNIPIILAGLFIKLYWTDYENSYLREPFFIGIVSIIMSIILYFSEMYSKRLRKIKDVSINDGIVVGFSQVLALIPGVSRSGITISSSLLSGLDRPSAARFSFLLGIPAIFLSGLVEIQTAFLELSFYNFILLLLGISSAAITSFFSIDFLIKFLKNYSIKVFVVYRIIFGTYVLFLVYKNIL